MTIKHTESSRRLKSIARSNEAVAAGFLFGAPCDCKDMFVWGKIKICIFNYWNILLIILVYLSILNIFLLYIYMYVYIYIIFNILAIVTIL